MSVLTHDKSPQSNQKAASTDAGSSGGSSVEDLADDPLMQVFILMLEALVRPSCRHFVLMIEAQLFS